ncbi:14657_t:CDS:1 [Funneliformis geosporum]|nr:14657_t:CDS:1 [Funneliformis geosporum]
MSERTGMILFGLTGQGKSSIANMLIQGDVYREVTAFKVNEGTAGVTINSRVNDKFIVYDLIGIDEIVEGSVPHKKIIEKIRHGFVTRQVSFNYIAYVKKEGRFTEEDRKMFKLFKEIFKGCENNFIIIITNSEQKWVEKNLITIKEKFGDYPIIPVDFPRSEEENDDIYDRTIKRNKRIQNLQSLTERLLSLKRGSIKLQALDLHQTTENKIAQVIDFIPIAGSAYQLISSGVYYSMGESKLAKERLINGVTGAVMDIASAGALRTGVSAGKLIVKGLVKGVAQDAGKSAFKVLVKGAAKSVAQSVAKEVARIAIKKSTIDK